MYSNNNNDDDKASFFDRVNVTVEGRLGKRIFTIESKVLPKNQQTYPPNPRRIEEAKLTNSLFVQTNNSLFDALYALTLQEVDDCAVDFVSDDSYGNQPLPENYQQIPGKFFDTGLKWSYIWTRDISYAVDLSLASINPIASLNSLKFKLSQRRRDDNKPLQKAEVNKGLKPLLKANQSFFDRMSSNDDDDDLQIIQDTGTGGSYPVSSDRVVWAFGASALLKQLTGEQRKSFAVCAYEAIKNTIEHDRQVIFDSQDGLYTGEESFLDWREQSYPEWMANQPVQIAMSKALSTNCCHLHAIELAVSLAQELNDNIAVQKYLRWATQLRQAIHHRFYLPIQQGEENLKLKGNKKLYSAFITTTLDSRPAHQYELLGNSLAVLLDIPNSNQASEIVSQYPHLDKGVPVIFPQQQFRREQPFWAKDESGQTIEASYKPIYHNRAIWAFVTTYWLRSAKKVKNSQAVTHAVKSLIKGCSLYLSNMENMDVVTGKINTEEGPAVNSPRQLWSVAGYLAMVQEIIFGLSFTDTGIIIEPYLTRELHHLFFSNSPQQLMLDGLNYKSHKIKIVINLPTLTKEKEGAYTVGKIILNGKSVGQEIDESMLSQNNQIQVDLIKDVQVNNSSICLVKEKDYLNNYRHLYAPYPPQIDQIIKENNQLKIKFNCNHEKPEYLKINVYRDGKLVAKNIAGEQGFWLDTHSQELETNSYCYTLESYYTDTQTISQRSQPSCYWGHHKNRILTIPVEDSQRLMSSVNDRIIVDFKANFSGLHAIQVEYANGAGAINTGITCGIKYLEMKDLKNNQIVASGYLMMPQLGLDNWSEYQHSSFIFTTQNLISQHNYQITIDNDTKNVNITPNKAINMSSFIHNKYYTGGNGNGGIKGVFNQVNISIIKVLTLKITN